MYIIYTIVAQDIHIMLQIAFSFSHYIKRGNLLRMSLNNFDIWMLAIYGSPL